MVDLTGGQRTPGGRLIEDGPDYYEDVDMCIDGWMNGEFELKKLSP